MEPNRRPEELTRVRPQVLEGIRSQWNDLAASGNSPFLTYEWMSSWWSAFGDGEPLCAFVHGPDSSLRAAAWCRLSGSGHLKAPTDPDYSELWDVVAVDDRARRDVWDAIARFGARSLELSPLPGHPAASRTAREALQAHGYRILQREVELNTYRSLPASWDELLGSVSRNLRSQWRRSRRDLEQRGELAFRTATTEAELARDFELFLKLEASGWKGREGTAIVCRPQAELLYRGFATGAARQGWLRLSILKSGGTPVAASLGCAFAGTRYRIKSGFDERYADCSPGMVLLAAELEESIDDGLSEYDFLGAPTPHKLRWGADTRPRIRLRAYRGTAMLPAYAYRAKLRPALGRLRRRARGALDR